MKVSKEKLKQMIKEELEAVMKESELEENLEEATPINKGTAGTRRRPGLTTVAKGDREVDRETGEDKGHVLSKGMERDAYADAARDHDRSTKRAGRGKDRHSGYKAADTQSGLNKLGEEVELEESVEDLEEVKAHGGAEEKGEHKGETKAEKEEHEKKETAAEEKAEHDKKKMEEAQIEELRESFRRFTKLPKSVLKD